VSRSSPSGTADRRGHECDQGPLATCLEGRTDGTVAGRVEAQAHLAPFDPSVIDHLEQALLEAAEENEAANDALCEYLTRNRGMARTVAERLLTGEHPSLALRDEDAAGRRESYRELLRRFEDSRHQMRRLVILWAKRGFGVSYRSMGELLGISQQMAIKLGGEAARDHPPVPRK
jgi:hypothetical protein